MKRLTSRAANLNSQNSIIFAELELELKKYNFLNSDLQIFFELEIELGQKSIEFATLTCAKIIFSLLLLQACYTVLACCMLLFYGK